MFAVFEDGPSPPSAPPSGHDAGVETKLWDMSDLVAIVEATEKAPGKRGPYKIRKGAAG